MDYIYILVVGILFLILSYISELKSDIRSINITLDKIAKQIGVSDTIDENIYEELKELVLEGKKVKAIKKYRIVSGVGLKEAKDYIDLLSNNISDKKRPI